MIEILEMRDNEIEDLLARAGYGHLGCARNNQPYVVPIHYAYDGNELFIYTTAGLKSEMIESNPSVCLQVEEIDKNGAWRSIIVMGEAHQIVDRLEREEAVALLQESNPTLLPALAIKWSKDWIRKNVEVVYKIKILNQSGRFTSEVRIAAASAQPHFCAAGLSARARE